MTGTAHVRSTEDAHAVVLDVAGMPLVAKPHGTVSAVPETITFTWRREGMAREFQLTRIVVEGHRARSDGSPGAARCEVSFYLAGLSEQAPEWLVRLSLPHAPLDIPVARTHPITPAAGLTLTDLDRITP